MGLFKRSLAAALLTVGSLSMPAVDVMGQSRPAGATTELSDQKLDATAAALGRVASLQKDYRQRVADAQMPADKERIVAEANVELAKAITDQGLSVEEYESILDVARDNADVRGKILERIRPADK
jgi:Domain of unknown function (DUF4168)